MSDVQLLLSCVGAFFIPGLGQIIQGACNVPGRIRTGIIFLCLAMLLGVLTLGVGWLVVWLWSFIECIVFSLKNSSDTPKS